MKRPNGAHRGISPKCSPLLCPMGPCTKGHGTAGAEPYTSAAPPPPPSTPRPQSRAARGAGVEQWRGFAVVVFKSAGTWGAGPPAQDSDPQKAGVVEMSRASQTGARGTVDTARRWCTEGCIAPCVPWRRRPRPGGGGGVCNVGGMPLTQEARAGRAGQRSFGVCCCNRSESPRRSRGIRQGKRRTLSVRWTLKDDSEHCFAIPVAQQGSKTGGCVRVSLCSVWHGGGGAAGPVLLCDPPPPPGG